MNGHKLDNQSLEEQSAAILKQHEQRRIDASRSAKEAVIELCLPQSIDFRMELLQLGSKTKKEYDRLLQDLQKSESASLSQRIAAVLHDYWYQCFATANVIQSFINEGEMLDNEYTRALATPEGYASDYGMTATYFDGLSDHHVELNLYRSEIYQQKFNFTPFSLRDSLNLIGLYWFNLAADAMEKGEVIKAFDMLHEAYDARRLESGDILYEIGMEALEENSEKGGIKEAMSKLGAKVKSGVQPF